MSLLKLTAAGMSDYTTGQITTVSRVGAAASGFTSLGQNLVKITLGAAHGWSFTPTSPELPVAFVKFAGTAAVTGGTGVLVGNVFRVVAMGTGSNSITVGGTTTNLANTDFVIYTTVTAATVNASTTVYPCYFPYFFAASLTTTASPNAYSSVASTYVPYNASQGSCMAWLGSTTGNVLSSNSAVFVNGDNTLVPLDSTTGNTPSTVPVSNYIAPAYASLSRFGAGDYIAQVAANAGQTTVVSIIN